MLLATSRWATPSRAARWRSTSICSAGKSSIWAMRRIDHAGDFLNGVQDALRRWRRLRVKFGSWIWMSIGAARPKFSTWLTMSAVWK